MAIQVVYSEKTAVKEAVSEIKDKLEATSPKLVVFFASSSYEPNQVSKMMKDSFDSARVIGCSTSGELISGKVLKNSIVAMSIPAEHINDTKVEVLTGINKKPDVKKAVKSFEKYFKEKMDDSSNMVGIILTDGLSGAEEKIMYEMGTVTDVPFIGGSAGDDLKFKATYVYADGKAYTNASVLLLIETKNGFSTLKTQSFKSTGKTLTATDVDEAKRMVKKFDGKPAIEAYAEAIGKKKEEAANSFMHNPVGLMVDNNPFVRSPQRTEKDNIFFYCNIEKGTKLEVLESVDIIKHTEKDLKNKLKETGKIAGMVNFHCILRTLELEQKKQTAAYGNLFKSIPTVGFSTYGEVYMYHMNQTSTITIMWA